MSDTFESWFANLTSTREANTKYWVFTKPASAEEMLREIERDSEHQLKLLKRKPKKSGLMADIRRVAIGNLRECAVTLAEPPPPALIKVLAELVGIRKKRSQVRSKEKFNAAARYAAAHPDATTSELRTAIGGDFRQIRTWQALPEFKRAVQRYQQSLATNNSAKVS